MRLLFVAILFVLQALPHPAAIEFMTLKAPQLCPSCTCVHHTSRRGLRYDFGFYPSQNMEGINPINYHGLRSQTKLPYIIECCVRAVVCDRRQLEWGLYVIIINRMQLQRSFVCTRTVLIEVCLLLFYVQSSKMLAIACMQEADSIQISTAV